VTAARDNDELLRHLQKHSFDYFVHEVNPRNGLILDKTADNWPCSIAAVGMALTAYPVGVERKFMARAAAVERTLLTLRFFAASEQSESETATGYRGFYYHFLDMESGKRAWRSELSSVDTAIFIAGAIAAAQYFDRDTAEETEIRALAKQLYERIEWDWMLQDGETLCHGWRPGARRGLPRVSLGGLRRSAPALRSRARLADARHPAALLRRVVPHLRMEGDLRHRPPLRRTALHPSALAHLDRFPRHPRRLHARPRLRLLREQPPGDARPAAVRDPKSARIPARRRAVLGGERERRAGPGAQEDRRSRAPILRLHRARRPVRTRRRHAGAVGGRRVAAVRPRDRACDGGELSQAPRPRRQSLRIQGVDQPVVQRRDQDDGVGWVSPFHFGINEGPTVLMIENHRSGMVWSLTRRSTPICVGLRAAGFTGGWLDDPAG
jgi:hypothetical protein